MKRRNFIKSLGAMIGTAMAAPSLLLESSPVMGIDLAEGKDKTAICEWSTKGPDEILHDLNEVINDIGNPPGHIKDAMCYYITFNKR